MRSGNKFYHQVNVYVFMCIIILGSCSVYALFDCDAEYCNYNGTSDQWDCYFMQCPEKPDFIQNDTIIQIINVTVSNCSEQQILDAMYDTMDNFIWRIDSRFNSTIENNALRDSKGQCIADLAECTERSNYLTESLSLNFVNRSSYQYCSMLLNESMIQVTRLSTLRWWTGLIGALIGIAGFHFITKFKPQLKKTDVEPSQGEGVFNVQGIEKDAQIASIKNEMEELKKSLAQKNKK